MGKPARRITKGGWGGGLVKGDAEFTHQKKRFVTSDKRPRPPEGGLAFMVKSAVNPSVGRKSGETELRRNRCKRKRLKGRGPGLPNTPQEKRGSKRKAPSPYGGESEI